MGSFAKADFNDEPGNGRPILPAYSAATVLIVLQALSLCMVCRISSQMCSICPQLLRITRDNAVNCFDSR